MWKRKLPTLKARFRDCLSRQFAKVISIMYTKDQQLNSKNEYMANCLTRICVEESGKGRRRIRGKGQAEII
jgi:hypothetical protein